MMDTVQLFPELSSPNFSPAQLTETDDLDSKFKQVSEFPFDPPESQQFLALSPTISRLDHQEIVETAPCLNSLFEHTNVPETTDLFSFELESNGIPNDLKNLTDPSISDLDWFDLIDTSDTSGELNDIRLSPVPRHHLEPIPVQPNVDNSKPSHSVPIISPAIPCPVPTRIFDSNSQTGIRRERKSPNSVRLELSDMDCLRDDGSVFDEGDDTEDDDDENDAEKEASDEDLRNSSEEAGPTLPKRPHTTSLRCPDKYLHNEDLINGKPGQRLQLSAEETKMLHSMGIRMPSRFPLSRAEERALRTVRRKIRNKLSAQASRARRQEYVANLEYRVKLSDKENQRLRRQVTNLQNDKRDLIAHVRRLRSYVSQLLYKDDKSTLLPLFVRAQNKPNKHSVKSATQAATAAAGGTSLLIVTFMILGWTATVPISPAKNGSVPALSTGKQDSMLNFFPGRSRNLLESRSLDGSLGSMSGAEFPSPGPGDHADPVSNLVRDPPQVQKVTAQVDSLVLEDAPVEHHNTNDSTRHENHVGHVDNLQHEDNAINPTVDQDALKSSQISLPSSSLNFPSILDL